VFLVSCSAGKVLTRRKTKRNAKPSGGKRQGSRAAEQTTTRKRRTKIARFGKLSLSERKFISELDSK
jgi:hypothetical protein